MNDHRHYEDLLALYAFGRLEEDERLELESHLATGCDSCNAELAELEEFAADVEYAAPAVQPTAARRRALLDSLAEGPARVADRPAPATERKAVDLVGREGPLREIDARVDTLLRGDGAFLSIEGEGGIGKSRLVAELETRAAARNALVLVGSSGDGGDDVGYHPIIECLQAWVAASARTATSDPAEALRDAIGGLNAELPAEVLPAVARLMSVALRDDENAAIAGLGGEPLERVLHNSVRDLLRAIAARRTLVLIFEDLHWADPSSVDMIEVITSIVDQCPLLVVGVSRTGYPQTSGRLLEHARAEHALHSHHIAVGPLADAETRKLVRAILGSDEFPEAVYDFVIAKCEGNPFFTEQAVHSLLDTGLLGRDSGRFVLSSALPTEGIGEAATTAIAMRLGSLEADERAVLQAASVIGRYVHRRVLDDLVGRVYGESVDVGRAIARLDGRDMISRRRTRSTARTKVVTLAAEEGYRFKHALLRDAVYDSIDEDRRRELHLSCAAIVEQAFEDRLHDFYAALAVHYSRGGELSRATEYLLQAGDHATTSAASDEALRLFREAHRVYRVAYGSSGPRELEAKLEGNLGRALLNTGHLGESIEHFNDALRLHGQWVPRTKAGLYAKFAWDVPNVLARLYTGRLLGTGSTPHDQGREIYDLLYARCRAQNIVDAQRNFFDNFASFHFGSRHGYTHGAGSLAATGAFFAFSGLSFGVAERFLDVARQAAEEGNVVDDFLVEAMEFVHHFLAGDWSADHDVSDEKLREGLRHGMLWDADVYLGLRCERDIRQGRFEQAERGIEELRDLADEWGYAFARSNELANAAYLAVERRDLDGAGEALDRWYDSRQEETLHLIAHGTRAKIETLRGDLAAAERALDAGAEIMRSDSMLTPYYTVVQETSRLRLAVTRADLAVQESGSAPSGLLDSARAALAPAMRSSAKVFRERIEVLGLSARTSWLSARHDDARGIWREALTLAEDAAVRPELARLAREIGLALASTPGEELQGTTSSGWLERAKDGFAELGSEVELADLEVAKKRRRVA